MYLNSCRSNLCALFVCLVILPLAFFTDGAYADGLYTGPTPAVLQVSADQELVLTLVGRGVQIYKWQALPGAKANFVWVLQRPEAELFDMQGRKVGRHFNGPTWELAAGDKLTGHLRAKADAPDGCSIPWLLLDALEASGSTLAKVKSIQRVDTVGGEAPSEPGSASEVGTERQVRYTAIYKFYAPKSFRDSR